MATRKLEVEIVGDARSLRNALNDSNSGLGRFGGALRGAAKAGALAAGAAGVGALFVTLRAGISEFTEATKVAAQTNAVIKSTGGVANVTARQVETLATAISRKSGIDDETVKSGQNLLLTFTNIRNEVGKGNNVFDQATLAITDMSVALGQDMKSSAIQVGKALQDPIRGITALRRVGVAFTDAQQAQIKALVDSGRAMDAQKIILRELNTEFGGSAEAVGKTLPGQLNILKETFNNLAGDLVAKAIPAVTTFVEFLNEKGIPILGEAFGRIGEVAGPAISGLGDVFKEAGPIILGVLEPLSGVIRDVLLPVFGQLRDIGTEAMGKISDIIKQNGPELQTIFSNLGTVISNLAKIVIPLLDFAFTTVLPAAISILLPVLAAVTTAIAAISTAVATVVRKIEEILLPAFGFIIEKGGAVARFLKDTLVGAFNAIEAPVKGAGDVLRNVLGPAFDAVTTAADKVRDAFEWLKNNAVKIFKGIQGPLVKALSAITEPFARLSGVLNAVIAAIDGVVGRVDDIVDAASKIGGAIGGIVGKLPGLASGGPVEAGRAYIVGERGPELFVPGKNGMIVPNLSTPPTTTVAAGGGGGATINVYGNLLTTQRELEDMVRNALYNVSRRNPGTGL